MSLRRKYGACCKGLNSAGDTPARRPARPAGRRAPPRDSPFGEIGGSGAGIVRVVFLRPFGAAAVRGFHPGFRFAPPMGYDPAPLRGSKGANADEPQPIEGSQKVEGSQKGGWDGDATPLKRGLPSAALSGRLKFSATIGKGLTRASLGRFGLAACGA